MKTRRIMMSLFGVIVCAISVAFFKIAAFGVDPFQAFMSGLNQLVTISFGVLYMIVNALLLIFSIIFDRTNIGIATFINLFLLGYITQYTYDFLQMLLAEPNIIVRGFCLVFGIIVMCDIRYYIVYYWKWKMD